jgi:hypothetical protein
LRTIPSEAENITVERRELGQHLDLDNSTGPWCVHAREVLWQRKSAQAAGFERRPGRWPVALARARATARW